MNILASAALGLTALVPLYLHAQTNIVANGDFSQPLKPSWMGGSFGGGEGGVKRLSDSVSNAYVRLEKTKGPGGVQIMSQTVSLGGAKRFRLSMRLRGNSSLGFVRYRSEKDGRWTPVKGPTGAEASAVFDMLSKGGRGRPGEWTAYVHVFDVPRLIQEKNPGIMLQFQAYPKKDGSAGFLEIDDIAVEALEDVKKEAPAPVSLVSRKTPLAGGYRRVERIFPLAWTCRDGLFYRNGKPYFFTGWGDSTGAGMEGAQGIWLARLQGMRFLGTYEETNFRVDKIDDMHYEVVSAEKPGWISWQRESARMGMLTEPHPLVNYSPKSSLGKFVGEHPEWRDVYFDLGHYVGMDCATPLGCEILVEARRHYFGHTHPHSLSDYCEIAREPGIENFNARMLRAFQDFARRKYDGSLSLANRVWGTDFAAWEDVKALHLDKDAIAASAHALALRRHVRAAHPNHYYDFLRFMQLDTAKRTRLEFEGLRRAVPGLPVTVDMRAHHAYTDGYCAFDPDLIAPYEDICHVHNSFQARTYNHTPWHEPTLASQTAYPFLAYGYMVRNTQCPVVQSEDIIARALLPGSDAEAMADNDFAALHKRPWKFRLEGPGEEGVGLGWHRKGFDDASWGEVAVPGAWDQQDAYKGRTGIGWYRVRFTLPARLKNDYLDGSRTFLVHGKGVAQSGTLWLNGEKVGTVKGWSSPYSFDVGALLKYGEENELVWRVVGDKYQNGLRFYCHVLCSDMLNHAKPFGEKQYAQMYWTYLMRGLSGVLNWNWHDDRLMPYLPGIIAPLETAAQVVLPPLRSRRSNVAYLYGYLSERGLPYHGENRHYVSTKWFNALEFSGIRPDVVSEQTFVRDVTPEKYPLLVVPASHLVDDATYAHFKRYLDGGGRAIITTNALRMTFSRYAKTDVDTLSKGIVRMPADLPLGELMAKIKPFLPPPPTDQAFSVESSCSRETPLIERILTGSEEAKVLYLGNWGGFDHGLEVTLPGAFDDWTLTPLRGSFERRRGALAVTVPSQDAAACLLTRKDASLDVVTKAPAANEKAWKRLIALNKGEDTPRPNVLWAGERHLYPYLLERFDAKGYDNIDGGSPAEWTPETLERAQVIVIAEGATQKLKAALGRRDFVPMLKAWVEKGGSLYVMAFSAGTINAYGSVLRSVARAFKMTAAWASVPKDEANMGLGDPWQILSTDIGHPSALTHGVKAVQLFTLTPLKVDRGASVIPVVRIPRTAHKHGGDLAMGAAIHGKGRVFVSADAMFCQPMRIECADNAALLENIVGWLVRQDVTDEMRKKFRAEGLFLDKTCFE